MILRIARLALVAGIAVFYSFVVFNNTTDYDSNYQFVRHVLMMDSTFPQNHGMWRAINRPLLHQAFYLSIIAWEIVTTLLLWVGAIQMASALRRSALDFHLAKQSAIVGLALSLTMWLVAFLSVGGEWFLMWQSKNWNGQEAAFRMFTVVGIVLLFLSMPEAEVQP